MAIKLVGNWKEGIAFDYHTESSIPKSVDETGKVTVWDTKRPPMGQALYEFKYCNDISWAPVIAKCIYENFILVSTKEYKFDVIVPIPPSKERPYQPVYEIMKHLIKLTKIPIDLKSLIKNKPTGELKSVENLQERAELLKGAFKINGCALEDKIVLLFDDLYRSGETLKAATEVLYNEAKVKDVYVLTLTKTRSKK